MSFLCVGTKQAGVPRPEDVSISTACSIGTKTLKAQERLKKNVSEKTWNEWGTIWEHGIHF